jgi:hypothetical protein
MMGPSKLTRRVVLSDTLVSLRRFQPTRPSHLLIHGKILNLWDGFPVKWMGYCSATSSGTSSLGGGCAVVTFRTWTTVAQALKKQIITVFEPMYLKILNNDMVGFANTTARGIIENLFFS